MLLLTIHLRTVKRVKLAKLQGNFRQIDLLFSSNFPVLSQSLFFRLRK